MQLCLQQGRSCLKPSRKKKDTHRHKELTFERSSVWELSLTALTYIVCVCVCVCVAEKHSCHKGKQDLSCHISSCWSSLEQDGLSGNCRTKPSGDFVGVLLYKVLRRYFFKQALDVPLILCWAAEDGKKRFRVKLWLSVQTDSVSRSQRILLWKPTAVVSFILGEQVPPTPWEFAQRCWMGPHRQKCWGLVEQLVLCTKSP